MESNSYSTGVHVSGNTSADCTLLLTDIFNLFPSSFDRLVPLLENRYRVVNYSDNGFDIFNRTKQLRHSTIAGYANDLVVSLQEKKIRNVTYLAHSANAFIAFHAANMAPHLFDKVVLLSAMPCLKQDAQTQYQCGFNATITNDVLFEKIIRTDGEAEKNTEQLTTLLKSSFSKISEEKAKQVFNLLMTSDSRSFLSKLSIPVMILQGTGDKFVTNEAAFFMHRHIPESYIVKIKAKGHLPQFNAPEEVFKAIEIFMHPIAC